MGIASDIPLIPSEDNSLDCCWNHYTIMALMSLSGPNLQLFSAFLRGPDSWKWWQVQATWGIVPASWSASSRECLDSAGHMGTFVLVQRNGASLCGCQDAFVWWGCQGPCMPASAGTLLVLCEQVLHLKRWHLTVSYLHFAVTWLFCSTPHGQLLLYHERSHSLITCDWPYPLAALWMGFIWTIFIWGK